MAEPYAWAIYESKKTITCRFCMTEVDGNVLSLVCSRCKEVRYCSRQCQRLDKVRCRSCARNLAPVAVYRTFIVIHILGRCHAQTCNFILIILQKIHRADECAVLRNWELDRELYGDDVIAEMKLLARVLSRKTYEIEAEDAHVVSSDNPDLPRLQYNSILVFMFIAIFMFYHTIATLICWGFRRFA